MEKDQKITDQTQPEEAPKRNPLAEEMMADPAFRSLYKEPNQEEDRYLIQSTPKKTTPAFTDQEVKDMMEWAMNQRTAEDL
jgi:hypothetical protein